MPLGLTVCTLKPHSTFQTVLIPALPFRLVAIGYDERRVSSLTSYLFVAYTLGNACFGIPIAFVLHRSVLLVRI